MEITQSTNSPVECRSYDTVTGWRGPIRGRVELAQKDAAEHDAGCAAQGGYGSTIVIFRDPDSPDRAVDLNKDPVWPSHGRSCGSVEFGPWANGSDSNRQLTKAQNETSAYSWHTMPRNLGQIVTESQPQPCGAVPEGDEGVYENMELRLRCDASDHSWQLYSTKGKIGEGKGACPTVEEAAAMHEAATADLSD